MKNRSGAVIFAVFFGILFLLGSCADLFNPPGEPGPAVGKVRLSILLEDASRTALPQGRFDKYVLRFHYEGEGGYTHEDLEGTSGFSVDLEPGVWTISADAYAGAVLSGTGRVTVTVGAGLTAPVTIRIEVMETAGMPGTLSYTVSYPAAGSDHAYGSQTLTVFDISNDTVVASKTIRSGVPGSSELAPGVYLVTAIINDTVQRTQAQRTVAAHIYAGQETVLEIDIGGEEFTAAIPLTGTIGAAGGPPADSRVIRVYADAGCTSLVGVSGELDDEGRFVVWVPSKDIPPDGGTVYMRQEITVNGVTTTGTAQSVIIAENQEEPPVINWEAEGGDLFYAVAVDGGISGGTVSASLEAAFPGTLVTLTVVPLHEAAALKPGTVKVNGGGATLTGSGPYTFTMPAGDVTVTAEFFNGRRYVRETAAGTGDGSSWANASDDLQKMMDEAAEAEAAQGLEALVRVAAGTYKPRYQPMVPVSPAGPYARTPPGNPRDAAFILRKGVEVRGGYSAEGEDIDEAARKARFNTYGVPGNPAYRAVLSGDIGTPNYDADNTYHVVLALDIPAGCGTILDGFTISGGYADGSGELSMANGGTVVRRSGGGIYISTADMSTIPYPPPPGFSSSTPVLTNVIISGNYAYNNGGGIFNGYSSPGMTNVTISDNTTDSNGGGMINGLASPVLTNVIISGNHAAGGGDNSGGGGMYNIESSPVLTGVIISGNSTARDGGGMYNLVSSPVLNTVTISDNTAGGVGSGMYNGMSSSPNLASVTAPNNSIVFAVYFDPGDASVLWEDMGRLWQYPERGGKAVEPDYVPTKPGYTLAGWYEDEDGTIPYDYDKPVTRSMTLYAKWVAGGELVSIAEISDYLANAAGGATAANPLPLQVSIAFADGGWADILAAIATAGKYVALDLAECAMSGTEFDPYTAAPGGAEYIVSLVLPDAATSIKAGGRDPSFMHFSGLAVVYGGNITDIGKNAFGMNPDAGPKGLTNLTEANFPEAIVIGEDAFGGCTALETVNLPKVESIYEYAFEGCTALETVDLPKAESIGTGAFLNCGSLETVDLPKAESIGDGAFLNCISLETVNLPEAVSIGRQAFEHCGSLKTISLPNATDIDGYAFYGCTSLETVSLPKAGYIGEVAFGSCTALKTASFPNATTIGNAAFSSCTALETVSGENITGIDHYAFNGCIALKTASFPNATSIGNSAFRDCTALKTASFPNATVIDGYAFYGCTSLETVSLPNATGIGQNAFNGCNALTAITIGGNLDVSDSGIPYEFEAVYNSRNKEAGLYSRRPYYEFEGQIYGGWYRDAGPGTE